MEVITINPVTYKITESKIKSCITLRYRAIGSAIIQKCPIYRPTNKEDLVMININVRLIKLYRLVVQI